MSGLRNVVNLGERLGAFRGFTLLELVAVLFIVGLIAGFAVLAVGDGGRGEEARREAERLRALCQLASQEAILAGREMGVKLTGNGYRFLELKDEGWVAMDGDADFSEHTLPPGLRRDLLLEGRQLPGQTAEAGALPELVFFTDGEVLPFQITVTDEHSDRLLVLTGKANGVLALEQVERVL